MVLETKQKFSYQQLYAKLKLKTFPTLKAVRLLTTNKTRVLENLLLVLFLASQISERVDNDTKYQVEYNDDDHKEEQQVVNDSAHKHVVLQGGSSEDISDAPSISETLIQGGDNAHYQGITGALLYALF